MEKLNLEKDEHIEQIITPSLKCEAIPVLLVLLLPLSMIVFSNRFLGVVVGIVFLLFILYGIFEIYMKLFNKKIFITNKHIIIQENRYFNASIYLQYALEDIINIDYKQTLMNKFCELGKLTLEIKNDQIEINNIEKNKIEYFATRSC